MCRSEDLKASPPMFKSASLDRFTRVHPGRPGAHLPARHRRCCSLTGVGRRRRSAAHRPGAGGYAFWTLTEYWLHRVVFHFEPEHGHRRAAALDDPRRPPRPPERPAAARDAAVGQRPARRWSSARLFWLVLGRGRARRVRRRLPGGLPRLRHDPLPRAPPRAAHAGRAASCASCTCATTSRTTSAASASARRTGITCSAPQPRPQAAGRMASSQPSCCRDRERRRQRRPSDEERSSTACPSWPSRGRARAGAAVAQVPGRAGGGAGGHRLRGRRGDRGGRAPRRRALPRGGERKSGGRLGEIVDSNSFLVDVHLLRPRTDGPPLRRPGATGRRPARSSCPPWPFRLRGGSPRRAAAPARRRRFSGCCTATARRCWSARSQPAPDRVVFVARGACRGRRARGLARLRFATGVDEDLRAFHNRFRDDPVIGGRACGAAPALRVRRARAVGGARLGDHRAADRVRARRADPAPADRPARAAAAPRPGCATCRRPPSSPPRVRPSWRPATSPRRARSRCAERRARWPRGACGSTREPRRCAACGRIPGVGRVDDGDARALRAGPLRPRARRATWATSRSWGGCRPATPALAPTRPRCAASSTATASGRAGRRVPAPGRRARAAAIEAELRGGRAPRGRSVCAQRRRDVARRASRAAWCGCRPCRSRPP